MPELATMTLHLLHPTCRKGWPQVTLRPGVINDQALEVFGFSQCALLACALHEETGWSILGVETQCPAGCWQWGHVGVQTPCGRFLDIQGARPCAEAQREWSAFMNDAPARTVVLSTFADLHCWMEMPSDTSDSWWRHAWSSGDADVAAAALAPFVSTLLAAYQAQSDVAA